MIQRSKPSILVLMSIVTKSPSISFILAISDIRY